MNGSKLAITVSLICLSISFSCFSRVQPDSTYFKFLLFSQLYSSGYFGDAERCMLSILEQKDNVPVSYYISAINNIGLVKKCIGQYKEAIDYYKMAEGLLTGRKDMIYDLTFVYNNIARIYTFQKSYQTAIEYLEKSIWIHKQNPTPSMSDLQIWSSIYLNLGIIYYETSDYSSALINFMKSDSIKTKFNLTGIELVYLNLANSYAKIANNKLAGTYYERSLRMLENEYGNDYYRISDVLFNYGDFLYKTGKTVEAIAAQQNALRICLKNYGARHPLVSLAYKKLADYYLDQSDYKRSLEYYQKALIALDNSFDNSDPAANPSIDSSLFELRLLDILKSKAKAMELYAINNDQDSIRIRFLKASLNTSDLSFQLIDRIRNSYLTEESRLYLSDSERDTYITGIRTAGKLFSYIGDDTYLTMMYNIVQRAKAANLRNSIISREAYRLAGIPDSVQEEQNRLAASISAYKMLISGTSETNERNPEVLQLWKDELFNLNRKMERLISDITETYPDYNKLLRRVDPEPLDRIRKYLGRDQTILDYLFSEPESDGSRDLYLFIISEKDIRYQEIRLDSSFQKNAVMIRNSCLSPVYGNVRGFSDALSFMYNTLVRPAEKYIRDDKILVIPDEEISFLPFEAFISGLKSGNIRDFGDADFLVNKYSVSYSFSSSLIVSKNKKAEPETKVISFAPFEDQEEEESIITYELTGAISETRSIYKWFRGEKYEGSKATLGEFRKLMIKPAIFHLAMHSYSDTSDSRYSYMQFWTPDSGSDDGRLYNYEISLSAMSSPMVVLSSCSSGSGRFYPGEGVMSLARGFILAGASSVVKTSWEVNDEVSAEIVKEYYKQLSDGKGKDESLRLAKLDYLKNSPPSYSHPYYWASYELVGDNSPLKKPTCGIIPGFIFFIMVAGIVTLIYRR